MYHNDQELRIKNKKLSEKIKKKIDLNNYSVVIPNTMVPCFIVMTAACDPEVANTVTTLYGERHIEVSTDFNGEVTETKVRYEDEENLIKIINEKLSVMPDPIF